MIALLAAVIVLASAQNTAAPPANTLAEPRQLAEDAMKYVAANDFKGLFVHLGKHMPMKKAELDAIQAKFADQVPVLGSLRKYRDVPRRLASSSGLELVERNDSGPVLDGTFYVDRSLLCTLFGQRDLKLDSESELTDVDLAP